MSNTNSQFETLQGTARFLRGKANRYAWMGLGVAFSAILAATLLSCRYEFGSYSIQGMIAVHTLNPALWLLDAMPLLFMVWGQYIGVVMSYQAGALVMDETRELRERTHMLEYQLGRVPAAGGEHIGLPNRTALEEQIARTLAQQPAGPAALLVFNTDSYREVEQGQGEAAAREFIAQIAYRLRSVLGQHEFLAHLGHDDFAIWQKRNSSEDEARRLASRIQVALDTPLTIKRQAMSVRAAAGIALLPLHGADTETLIRHAETAKFAAAAERRDYRVYEHGLENDRTERPRLMAELHAALSNDGLTDEYLPQLPRYPGLPTRLRLLPRWQHPRRGLLEEAVFLSLPDRAGLAHSYTAWLLQQGLGRLSSWRRNGDARLQLLLRLPDAAYASLPLADIVMRLLTSHDLPADALVLEADENVIGQAPALAQIQALHAVGVPVQLAGAAPTRTLGVNLHGVRLPAALLRRAAESEDARGILRGLVPMFHQLNLRVTCAGVDDAATRELAAGAGADYLEGNSIHAPIAESLVTVWLKTPRADRSLS